jgi:rhodanese-related sulfurtransferase
VAEAVGLISVTELKARLDVGIPTAVLDVREEDERMYASIDWPEGVLDLHVPLGEVARRFEEIEVSTQGRPLVVYCHHGQRSMVAAAWLARRGIGEVINLEGGIDAWSARVDRSVPRY